MIVLNILLTLIISESYGTYVGYGNYGGYAISPISIGQMEGYNSAGMPISLANALALFCSKTRVDGKRPLNINRFNLNAFNLEIFSKILIKKTDKSLEFWIECKESVNGGFKQTQSPNGHYKSTSDRWPFKLEHQLHIVSVYLTQHRWIGPIVQKKGDGELYEYRNRVVMF